MLELLNINFYIRKNFCKYWILLSELKYKIILITKFFFPKFNLIENNHIFNIKILISSRKKCLL